MAKSQAVLAECIINAASDTIDLTRSYGVNGGTFTVVTPNTQYTFELEPGSAVAPNENIGVQVTQVGPEFARPMLINTLPNPLVGVDIASGLYDGTGVSASLNELRITVYRVGTPISTPS